MIVRSYAEISKLKLVCFVSLGVMVPIFAVAQCPNNPVLTPTLWAAGTGSATYSSSSQAYTVIGTGTYANGQHYENGSADLMTLAGNGQIIAEVTSISGNLGSDTVAGIFIRGDNTAGADGGLLWIRGSSRSQYQFAARINDGPLTEIESGTVPSLPYWLRLQNSGNVLYPSVSTNGSAWTLLPALDLTSDSAFIAGSTLAYGLMVWSGSDSKPTTAVFGNVCVNSAFSPYPTLTPTFTPTPTLTATYTATSTSTSSSTPTILSTRTFTPTNTMIFTTTQTPSLTPTNTVRVTPTSSPTRTFTSTQTNTPISTFTLSSTFSETNSPTFTHTSTITPTPTNTSSPLPTGTPTNTSTPPPGLKVWPNPFTPLLPTNNITHFLLPEGHGAGRLLIADLKRKLDRSIDFGSGADVQWDGRDNGGNAVSAGVYLYLLESDGMVRRGTITVMR